MNFSQVGLVLGAAALSLGAVASAKEPPMVDYRDGTSVDDGAPTDVKPLIPMKFIEEKDHFRVVSRPAPSSGPVKYNAAHFTLDGTRFEMLSTANAIFVSEKPFHPLRDNDANNKEFAPRLMGCWGPNMGGYGCRVYTGREQVVTLKAVSFGERDAWSVAIDPSIWVKAKGIDLGNAARLTIKGEGVDISKDYSLKPGMMLVHRPKLELQGQESDRILGALSQGKAITLQLDDKSGETHSYVISSRDARMGFFIFQRIWPELKAAAECKKKLFAKC